MAGRHEILTDRVNAEPAILRGCSSSELGMMLLIAVLFWLPAGVAAGMMLGAVFAALGIAAAGIIVTIWLGATWFQKIKRGRPDGYYQQRLIIALHDRRLRRSRFVRRSGVWDIGRG